MISWNFYKEGSELAPRVLDNPFSFNLSGASFEQFTPVLGKDIQVTTAPPEIAWVDLETTGLYKSTDMILEVGVVLTDAYGRVCQDGVADWLVCDNNGHEPTLFWEAAMSNMPRVVEEMHYNSKLLDDLDWMLSLSDSLLRADPGRVAADITSWLTSKFNCPPRTIPMSGSSVHFDRGFIEVQMPKLNEWFHYRNSFDVSAIREMAKVLNPPVVKSQPESMKCHRPIPDLIDSIRLYRHLLHTGFISIAKEIDS